MQEYKERIYRDYYRLHVLPRKGPLTQKKLISSSKSFDLHFGEFLPEDIETGILDVGCGSGALIWWLHSRGYKNAVGVDLSKDQIEAGQNLNIENLYNEELEDHLKHCKKRYKLVFLRDVMEHIFPAELSVFLDLIYSALEPQGRLVIQAPNAASPFFGRVLYGDFSHERAFTTTSLSQILMLSGFEQPIYKSFEPRLPKILKQKLFSKSQCQVLVQTISWSLVKRFYRFLLFAELGEWNHIVTYNLIVCATKKVDSADIVDK